MGSISIPQEGLVGQMSPNKKITACNFAKFWKPKLLLRL